MRSALAGLLDDVLAPCSPQARAGVALSLERFGLRALHFAWRGNVRIVALGRGENYADRSEAIRRMGVRVDHWPHPPAGLFVVCERTVYLRSTSAMTVAHEFAHAIDCVLGGGVYRSTTDPRIRRAYANAIEFVTPYAGTSLDEYFAESVRAYVDANDADSPWPRATPQRLAALDPAMYAYVNELFCNAF